MSGPCLPCEAAMRARAGIHGPPAGGPPITLTPEQVAEMEANRPPTPLSHYIFGAPNSIDRGFRVALLGLVGVIGGSYALGRWLR